MQTLDDLNDQLLQIEETLATEIDKANDRHSQLVGSDKIADYELEAEVNIYCGDDSDPTFTIIEYVKDISLPGLKIEKFGIGDNNDHHETFSRKTKNRMCWLTHCLLDGHHVGKLFKVDDVELISTIWYDLIIRVQFEKRFINEQQ